MVFLGAPEGLSILYRGDNRAAIPARGGEFRNLRLRDAHLLRRVGEDHRPILCSMVGTLAVELCRVVHLEEEIDQLFVTDLRRIEGNLDDLSVVGGAAAHLTVARICDMTAGIAGYNVTDAGHLAKEGLHAPKASGAKCGFLHGTASV